MAWKGYIADVYSNRYIQALADSAGAAVGSLGACPEGFCWYVERTTCYSNAGEQAVPLLELYVLRSGSIAPGDLSKSGRQDVYSSILTGPHNPKQGVHDYRSPIYVGPGYYLVAVWTALGSGSLGVLSSQIRVHRLESGRPHAHQLLDVGEEEHLPHARAVVVGDQVAAV